MDFDFSEEDQAIYDLTAQILGDKVTHEHLRALAADDIHLDRATWGTLADAGIVGAALPEAHGGSGLGFLAVSAVCELVGRYAASVPMLETIVMVGLPIAEFGTAEQQADLLPPMAAGELIATAALVAGDGFVRSGDTVSGSAPCVPMGLDADLFLVPTDDGVVLVDASADGVSRTPQRTTTDRPQALLSLDGAACTGLGSASTDEIVSWTRLRVDSAICSTLAGACKAATDLAADYAKIRHQFDRPIATFQAVSQRAGDAYIDTEGVNLTARQAAWRIADGRPAAREVAIARWWASEAGFRVVHAATHLHGGVGVDRDYPLHRYFLMARQLELTLGNSEEQLVTLGDLIAG